MPGSYAWINLNTAISQLGQRLNITPSASSFWTIDELSVYLSQALRIYNTLCWAWRQDFQFNSPNLWNSLGSLAGSPRLRTLTDTYAYTEIEYMLLEPPSGQVWSGTIQFQITDLSQALQRRRDEIIQITNCNQAILPNIPLTPNTIRTLLPDSVIDVSRVRYMALDASISGSAASGASTIVLGSVAGINLGDFVSGLNISYWATVTGIGVNSVSISIPTTGIVTGTVNFYDPTVLYRDDTVAQEFYEAPLYELPAGTPQTFSLSSEPPLSWQVDIPPDQAGVYEAIVLQSGAPFNPPTPTLLGIPDDWAYILEWGALADLLGRQEEATDRERSAYCTKRYQDGLQLMLKTPWIELGKVNGAAVSLDSIYSMDRYDTNWDSNPQGFGPVIVTGGVDWVAGPIGSGLGMTVLGNAPVPSVGTDFLQVSRSDWEIVILLAQSRACFKMGGSSFQESLDLEKQAILMAAGENSRLRSMGCFSDILVQRGAQEERDRQRYNSKSG